ncbi:LysM peptidoglycan-binding domain-containing protein [Kineosporia succinea]|uniref:Nucleoid-associated protein YgaU n=1 Tax=Kineosporia succinea TaxID=84632 RepID=A0ABT9NYJ8_9ACTN|nr:LysM peptidoglycan-binding domain-containing protein [Kineosporia succinea]MDP9825376.1 nucleoid-associated protein YgaU [Kineosporia succinea]
MSQTHLSSSCPASRGAAVLLAGLTLAFGATLQLARLTIESWAELHVAQAISADAIFGFLAGTVATGATAWLLLALTLSAVAAWGGRSRAGSRLVRPATLAARRIAPATVRNAVAALLGVALVATPAAAQASSLPASTLSVSSERAATSRNSPAVAERASPLLLGAAHQAGENAGIVLVESRASTRASGPADVVTPPGQIPSRPTDSRTETRSGTGPDASAREKLLQLLSPGWTPDRPRPTAATSGHAADVGVVAAAPRRATRQPLGQHVVVKRGDTLWSIAAQYLGPGATDTQIAHEWPRWYRVNRHLIGADPHRLLPGERLRSPDSAAPQHHSDSSSLSTPRSASEQKEAGR